MGAQLSDYIYADEPKVVGELLSLLSWDDTRRKTVQEQASGLVEALRKRKAKTGELETFLQQFPLNSPEGLSLMSLAEALLRIPDSATADALIKDKIAAADWLMAAGSDGKSGNWMTKAAGFGLSLTQKTLGGKLSGVGQPIVREAIIQAIRILGRQFVLGQTMEKAAQRSKTYAKKGYRFSYDMLGEGARTMPDAQRYFEAYKNAIEYMGAAQDKNKERPDGISVKLSALHPRYEYANRDQCVPYLSEKLIDLCRTAKKFGMALTVDAEEVDRLELSLEIIEHVLKCEDLAGWDGFGLAVQAYQKRCFVLIDYLYGLAQEYGRKIRVRLVKGAYWDTEIKRAQVMGLSDYPVFTRKANTDVSYLVCAQKLLGYQDHIFPMFATHNAHTMVAIMTMAQNKSYELQRLHGMGEGLYDVLLAQHPNVPVTIYAPVGSHEDLLPYLVRRLLENGANSSFVNKLLNPNEPIETVVEDPVEMVRGFESVRHPGILLPYDLFRDELPSGQGMRVNSAGMDATDPVQVNPVLSAIQKNHDAPEIGSLIGGCLNKTSTIKDSVNPAHTDQIVAHVHQGDATVVDEAFTVAKAAFAGWSKTPATDRAAALEKFADLLEKNHLDLMAVLSREAGKTIEDAHDEIREAVDFARYYAARGRIEFDENGQVLPGPTGEKNTISLHGRGVFVCISPWNFPLAIFTGQIVAALMAGNAVIAKAADQTSLIAYKTVQLMHEAGIPADAINLVMGRGSVIGNALTAHPDVAGVAFTGSTEVARLINKNLAEKPGPIVPFIAETGGQNAMIVDSSALAEQVVDDVIRSAFGSAGQRCSALRILCVQDEIADKVTSMLRGAMEQLSVGDPGLLSTDVGPVIDDGARQELLDHRKKLDGLGALIYEILLDKTLISQGSFFAPCVFEIEDIGQLDREVFGPVLHVVRFKREGLGDLIDQINTTGYGLTFGVHSRVESFQQEIAHRIKVGNVYVNRSMIGAVVGVQPFGGQGLSGTGPKAGGPRYLHRFALEKTISIDTTASGGNTSLVMMGA